MIKIKELIYSYQMLVFDNLRSESPRYDTNTPNCFVSLGNDKFETYGCSIINTPLLSVNDFCPKKTINGLFKSIFELLYKEDTDNNLTKEEFLHFIKMEEIEFKLNNLELDCLVCGEKAGKWIKEYIVKVFILEGLPENAVLALPEPEYTGVLAVKCIDNDIVDSFGIMIQDNNFRSIVITDL
jgi:hypothetical protein